MKFDRPDPGHQRIASFDIETTHWDATKGEVVSIGIAVHDRDTPLADAKTHLLHRESDRTEARLVADAYDILDNSDADFLVTFNGRDFDFPFCEARATVNGQAPTGPELHTEETHLDLLHDDRKAAADRRGEKWPGLEEVLAAYGYESDPTMWQGKEVTNTVFGDELGPAYLRAIEEDSTRAKVLRRTINDYLLDDIDKNLRIYYHDIGHEIPV